MNTEWSLDVYYKGYDDPAFAADFELLKKYAGELETALETARKQTDEQGLVTIIEIGRAHV